MGEWEMKKVIIVLSFTFVSYVTSMQQVVKQEGSYHVALMAHKVEENYKKHCFDFLKESQSDQSQSSVFSMNLLLTPDDKNLIIARNGGRVYKTPLLLSVGNRGQDNSEHDGQELKLFVEHARVKHVPMIKLGGDANRWDLVSAGNYMTEKGEYHSEVIVRQGGDNEISMCRKIPFSIQAIAVNALKKKIAISHAKTVRFWVPYEQEQDCHLNLNKHVEDQIITGIDFNNEGNKLLVCFNGGRIYLINCGEKIEATQYCTIPNTSIEKIHYADEKIILYSVCDGKVMMFDIYDFLNQKTDKIEPYFFDNNDCENVAFDQKGFGFVRWTKNSGIRKMIYARKGANTKELRNIILIATGLPDKYDYVSYDGALKKGSTFFVQCALFGDRVIAVGADGCLYGWNIPSSKDLVDHLSSKYNQEEVTQKSSKVSELHAQGLQEQKHISPRSAPIKDIYNEKHPSSDALRSGRSIQPKEKADKNKLKYYIKKPKETIKKTDNGSEDSDH